MISVVNNGKIISSIAGIISVMYSYSLACVILCCSVVAVTVQVNS